MRDCAGSRDLPLAGAAAAAAAAAALLTPCSKSHKRIMRDAHGSPDL